MERNEIIIISIFMLIPIAAIIVSILAYSNSVDTRANNLAGKVIDDDGKQVKISDYFNSNIVKYFMKGYVSNLNLLNYNDNIKIGPEGLNIDDAGFRIVPTDIEYLCNPGACTAYSANLLQTTGGPRNTVMNAQTFKLQKI
tara:strand:- start:983 stop:1405 length:423 start_codon:yes stop_codon:yes gene_type:complete